MILALVLVGLAVLAGVALTVAAHETARMLREAKRERRREQAATLESGSSHLRIVPTEDR